MERINRRKFLKGAAAITATIWGNHTPGITMAKPTLGDGGQDRLERYLDKIQPEKDRLQSIIEEQDLFAGFKRLTPEQRIEDFNMYFPLYRAGQEQYDIPWYLLWINHVHETTVSREKNPEKNGYKGAMQRSTLYYPDEVASLAAENWTFLKQLPQRYSKDRFQTEDYKEIMFAAWKINKDAQDIQFAYPEQSFEESILQAQYRYCAPFYARQRIKAYGFLKSILAA